MTLSHPINQDGGIPSNNNLSFFPKTAGVSAAVATTAVSVIPPRTNAASRPSMMAISSGSSRTLIELKGETNNTNTDHGMRCGIENNCGYKIDATYLDEDYDQGLLILRRVSIVDEPYAVAASKTTATPMGLIGPVRRAFGHATKVAKNPIVALVLVGNLATMIGILPTGIAGFLPAAGVVFGRKTRWMTRAASAVAKRGRFLARRGPVTKLVTNTANKPVFSKFRLKLTKLVSKLYKNRSKYSMLSDYCWYVQGNEEKAEGNKITATPSS